MLFALISCQKDEPVVDDIENQVEVEAPDTETPDDEIIEEVPAEPEEEKKDEVSSTPEVKPGAKPEVKPGAKPEEKPEAKPETKPEGNGSATLGNTMLSVFRENAGKSLEEIAEACTTHEAIKFAPAVMPVEPGFFAEFAGDIAGFDSGIKFGPMIGSIPFSGFVFEVSGDAESFADELRSKADPRWNICVEAEETIVDVSGNRVFFLMCPKDLDE